MKSVGIITFHCADNFGAVLQVYALQHILSKLDLYSEIIDYKPDILIIPYDYRMHWYETINDIGILRAIKRFILKLPHMRKIKYRKTIFEDFRKKNLIISKSTFFSNDELIANPPKYDYYITGSDQVWSPSFLNKTGFSYFLDFAPNESKKIAYAASIAENIEPELYDMYKNNIERFDQISIREKEHLYLLQTLTNKPIKITLDPTFLLDKNEWMNISTKPYVKDKYILIYDIQYNEELVKIANRITMEKDYKVISFMNCKRYKKGIKSFQYEGPCEFLGYIENAEFILSTSFHGVAFSIIFNKPFYAIPNKKTGSRITNLLSSLGLEDRIIHKAEEVLNIIYEIDYTKTFELLKKEKEESMNFLIKALDIDNI